MAEAPTRVALLVGDVARRGEVRRLARLVDRLAGRRVSARLLAAGGADELRAEGVDALEARWLDRPWLRRLAARGLLPGDPGPRPALVHALHDEVADAAPAVAARWGVPLIRTVEDDPPADQPARLDPAALAAAVVGDERLARDLAARHRLPPALLRVIAPGVEPPPGDEPTPAVPPAGRVPVIGAIGRFGPGSGFETFLDACHRLVEAGRDVEFLVAGLGPDEARVRRRADRLEIADRLTFAGPVALEGPFWRVVDLFCQPSAAATAARPLVAAMVAGLPCVAADVPGPRDLLAVGRGLIVPAGDPTALVRSLSTLLDQPLLARDFADRARSWARRHFDPDHEADALASLYARVAASPTVA